MKSDNVKQLVKQIIYYLNKYTFLNIKDLRILCNTTESKIKVAIMNIDTIAENDKNFLFLIDNYDEEKEKRLRRRNSSPFERLKR